MVPVWACSVVSWYSLGSVCPHPLNSLPSALLVSLGLGGNGLVVCLLSAGLNLFCLWGSQTPYHLLFPDRPGVVQWQVVDQLQERFAVALHTYIECRRPQPAHRCVKAPILVCYGR